MEEKTKKTVTVNTTRVRELSSDLKSPVEIAKKLHISPDMLTPLFKKGVTKFVFRQKSYMSVKEVCEYLKIPNLNEPYVGINEIAEYLSKKRYEVIELVKSDIPIRFFQSEEGKGNKIFFLKSQFIEDVEKFGGKDVSLSSFEPKIFSLERNRGVVESNLESLFNGGEIDERSYKIFSAFVLDFREKNDISAEFNLTKESIRQTIKKVYSLLDNLSNNMLSYLKDYRKVNDENEKLVAENRKLKGRIVSLEHNEKKLEKTIISLKNVLVNAGKEAQDLADGVIDVKVPTDTIEYLHEKKEISYGLYNRLKINNIPNLDILCTYTKIKLMKIENFGIIKLKEVTKLLKKHGKKLKS